MPVPDKIVALLDSLTLDQIDSLSPVARERFRQRCERWAQLAGEAPGAARREPKSGAVVFQQAAEAARALEASRPSTPRASTGNAATPARRPRTSGVISELNRYRREG